MDDLSFDLDDLTSLAPEIDLDDMLLDLDTGEDIVDAKGLRRDAMMLRRLEKRRFINAQKLQGLEQIIPTLPPPDADLFIITTGLGAEVGSHAISKSPDLGTFIPYLVRQLGDKDCTAYISTWTCNHFHSLAMLELLDAGKLKSLTYFSDPYFMQRSPAIATPLIEGLKARGQRVKLWKNHTKLIAVSNADQTRTCVIQSSANLSAQPRAEQLHLTTSPDVYQWITHEFFEAIAQMPDYAPKYKRPRKTNTPKVPHAAQEHAP